MRFFPKLRRTVQKPKVVSSLIQPVKTPPRRSQEVIRPFDEDNGFTFPVESAGIIAETVESIFSSDSDVTSSSDSFDSGGGDFGGAGGGSDW